MDLDELAKFLIRREREIREEFAKAASGLELKGVIHEIEKEREYVWPSWRGFREGDKMEVKIGETYGGPCCFYNASIYPDSIVLEIFGSRRTVAVFRGKEAEDCYKNLSAELVKAQKEDAHHLPF